MTFLNDPLVQTLFGFISLLLTVVQTVIALRSMPRSDKSPKTNPLPKDRAWRKNLSIIAVCLLMILYCSFDIIRSIQAPYPFSREIIILFSLTILAGIQFIVISIIKIIRGTPRIPVLVRDEYTEQQQ